MSLDEFVVDVDVDKIIVLSDGMPNVDVRVNPTPDVIVVGTAAMGPQGPPGVSGLPEDIVVASATRILTNKILSTDDEPTFRLLGSGKIEFGPGGSTPTDTNFYRSAAGIVKTDGIIHAVGDIYAFANASDYVGIGHIGPGGQAALRFAADTNLYRTAASMLKTDGSLMIQGVDAYGVGLYLSTGHVVVTRPSAGMFLQAFTGADTYPRFTVTTPGVLSWGNGAGSMDTTLYRGAAGLLKTDGQFTAVSSIYTTGLGATKIGFLDPAGAANPDTYMGMYYDSGNSRGVFGALSGGVAWRDIYVAENASLQVDQIKFGTAGSNADVNLYRYAANVLKTDDMFVIAGVDAFDTSLSLNNGRITWQRAASSYIMAGSIAGDTVSRFAVQIEGKISWGPGNATFDTFLYRSAAGVVSTDGKLYVGSGGAGELAFLAGGGTSEISIARWGPSSQGAIRFGNDSSAMLYRTASGIITSPGKINAVGGFQVNGVDVSFSSNVVAYAARTTNLALTGSYQDWLTAPAFTADGVSRYKIEVYGPYVDNAGGNNVQLNIVDGSTDLGVIARWNPGATGPSPISASVMVTPSAGSHTFKVQAGSFGGGTPTLYAGTGGVGSFVGAYIRITKDS